MQVLNIVRYGLMFLENFSKSVLDDPHILQGILNFKQYLPKAVDDRQIGISKSRQKFRLLCYNNSLCNFWLCNIIG